MYSHLYEIIVERARRYPSEPALGSQEGLGWRVVDSRELKALVDVAALELAAAGVVEGSRVVVWAPNHWRTVVFLFALWKLGAIAVPLDKDTAADAARRIFTRVSPTLILAGHPDGAPWAQPGDPIDWWVPGSRLPQATPADAWQPPQEPLATLSFTSGTTGEPKGCMITHANLCFEVDALQHTVPLRPGARLASVLPLSHLFELTVGMLYPLSRGVVIHHVPSRRGPDILRVLQEQRVTHMIVVPQLLTMMGDALNTQLRRQLPPRVYQALWDTSLKLPPAVRRLLFAAVHRQLGGHLTMMASGGAALPTETSLLWQRLGISVLQGYGSSECSPVVTSMVAGEASPLGSVGRPLTSVQVRLSADGEVLVKGPNVMQGYWQDPERTAATFIDGWYATGDLGELDVHGYLHILGRVKDLIVLPSGLKVWPEDVEDAFRTHPGVADAAVVAVPSPSGGVMLHAYLIPKGTAGDAAAVLRECNPRLAVHQRVSTASWWAGNDFPRTTTLKVKRNLLPKPGDAAATPGAASPAGSTSTAISGLDTAVLEAVATAARAPHIEPDQTLGSLGFDSLGLVQLAIALEEKTGSTITEDLLRPDMTVAELAEVVAQPDAAADKVVALPEDGWTPEPPVWPYTWGRIFRKLSLLVDVTYALVVTKTIVLGSEHLANLPRRVILAGTHHGFGDVPLVRYGLEKSPARHTASRIVIAAGADGWRRSPKWAWYGVLALGMFPLRQYHEREKNLRRLYKVAQTGAPILIFPQGTHSTIAEELADAPRVRFRTGVTHLAESLEAVVVPFGVANTEKVMPPNLDGYHGPVLAGGIPISFKRMPLAIAWGAPMVPAAGETAEAFARRLQEASYALTREAEAAVQRR